MLMFIWMCVMTSALMPGGERIATLQTEALETQIRATVETTREVMTLGWASEEEVAHF